MDITNFFQPKGGTIKKKKEPPKKKTKRKKVVIKVPKKKKIRIDPSARDVDVDRERAVGRQPHPFLMPQRARKAICLDDSDEAPVAVRARLEITVTPSTMGQLSQEARRNLSRPAPRFPSIQHIVSVTNGVSDAGGDTGGFLGCSRRSLTEIPPIELQPNLCITSVSTIEDTGKTRSALLNRTPEWEGDIQTALDIYLESYIRLTNESLEKQELHDMFQCVLRMRDDPRTAHALWPAKYSSMNAAEMEYFLGQPSYERLHDWITTWNRQMEVDSEDYSAEDTRQTVCTSGCVIVGDRHGFGKTMAVYKTAASLGYSVLEINAGDDRRGRNIDSLFKEASQSHLLADGKRDQQSTMLLFEDADIPMEEDTGFYKSLTALLVESRVPVVLTCSRLTKAIRELQLSAHLPIFQWDHSRWQRPLLFVQLVLLAEGALTDIFDLFLLCSKQHFDVRKTLLSLQLRLTKRDSGLRQLAVYEGADDVLSTNGFALYGSLFRAMLDSTSGPWLLIDTAAVKRLRQETRRTMLSHNFNLYSEYYPYLMNGVEAKHTAQVLCDAAEAPSLCDWMNTDAADDPLMSSITTCILGMSASTAVNSCDDIAVSLGEEGETMRVHAMQEQDGLLVKMSPPQPLHFEAYFGSIDRDEVWYLSKIDALELQREAAWDPQEQMVQMGQGRRTRNSCKFSHYLANHGYSSAQHEFLHSMQKLSTLRNAKN